MVDGDPFLDDDEIAERSAANASALRRLLIQSSSGSSRPPTGFAQADTKIFIFRMMFAPTKWWENLKAFNPFS